MLCRAASRPARRPAARAARRLPLFAASALLLASPAALRALSVDVTRIGLFGNAFPGADPELSVTTLTDPSGRTAGYSEGPGIVVDSQNAPEIAAWYRVGDTTTRVGLYEGPDFTLSPDSVGYRGIYSRSSIVLGLGQGTVAFGTSDRFSPIWIYAGTRPPADYSRQYDRGRSGWIYFGGLTTEVGLSDVEHTAFDGARFSTPSALNAAGQAAGTSSRFAAGLPINTNSTSTWFFNGTTTVRTGLVDGAHTADDNYHFSSHVALNSRGDAVGHTHRYGSTVNVDLGRSAWLHRDGQNIDLSLTGFEFEKAILDGETERTYRFSTLFALNDTGHIVGTSRRFSAAGDDAGQSVWRFGTTTRGATADISPAGAGFTRDDGYRFASPSWLNDNGEVVGIASRYLGSADGGRSAWLYSPDSGETLDISPTDSGFIRADGYRFATPLARTDLGHTIGSATRYSGSAENGQGVWRFNGEATLDIGLDTPEVVGPDGARTDTFVNTMPGGKVLGYSARTDGGREAWLHGPASRGFRTQAIGLSGPGRIQTIVAHTPAGQVVGHADHPDGGRQAWRYDGSVTTDIGMAGGSFETATGLRSSTIQFTNSRGDVAGVAHTYDETGAQDGLALWFNDGTLTRQVAPKFTETISLGYTYRATHLTDSGLVIGVRDFYSLSASPLYSNVFVWDSYSAPGEEMTNIDIGRLSGSRQVQTDLRFVSSQHDLLIGEYRNLGTNNLQNRFYVWMRGLGTFDLDSLVGTEFFNQTGISSLYYLIGSEFIGNYSFFESEDGVVMTIEHDNRAGGQRTYQLLINPAAVPEPASFGMLAGAGVLGLAAVRRRRRA